MKAHARDNGVWEIAMPMIGCGLDQLRWFEVYRTLHQVFSGSGIELKVYVMPAVQRFRRVNCISQRVKKPVKRRCLWDDGVQDEECLLIVISC